MSDWPTVILVGRNTSGLVIGSDGGSICGMPMEVYSRAAELTRLRAKVEAAEKLAEAIQHYKDFVLDHSGSGEVVPVITEPAQRLDAALAAYKEAGK